MRAEFVVKDEINDRINGVVHECRVDANHATPSAHRRQNTSTQPERVRGQDKKNTDEKALYVNWSIQLAVS